jgi:hypothetical protein
MSLQSSQQGFAQETLTAVINKGTTHPVYYSMYNNKNTKQENPVRVKLLLLSRTTHIFQCQAEGGKTKNPVGLS